jgi:transposase-like protein
MPLGRDESWCYEVLRSLRWPDGLECPYCRRRRVTSHTKSKATPRRRYLCLHCRGTFTDLTGTPMARTHLPLTAWFRALDLVADACSTATLARSLDVKWDTAAHVRRRIGHALQPPGFMYQLRQAILGTGPEASRRLVPARERDAASGESR